MNSLGILIPTRNSGAYLEKHLLGLRDSLALAQEIVAVDSDSADQTLALLQAHLPAGKSRILRHPPGLYASWNFGISQLTTEFVYIATVGDTIATQGLEKLRETAVALDCDLVASPPAFVGESGQPLSLERLPIERMIEELSVTRPAWLDPRLFFAYAMIFALGHGMNTPLGSSASNLYRTKILQKRPFPTDLESAGDALWGVAHGLDVRFGIMPENAARFLVHPRQHRPLTSAQLSQWIDRAAAAAGTNIDRILRDTTIEAGERALFRDLFAALLGFRAQQVRLEQSRSRGILAVALPATWSARLTRAHCRRRSRRCQAQLVARFPAQLGSIGGVGDLRAVAKLGKPGIALGGAPSGTGEAPVLPEER